MVHFITKLNIALLLGHPISDAVCTVLNSWWWRERPSETCRVYCSRIN